MAVFVISEDGLGTDSALFVGVIMALRSLIAASLQPAFGPLADRVNRLGLVLLGLGISAAGQFVFPSVSRTLVDTSLLGEPLVLAPWLLLVTVVIGVAEALAFPAQQAIFVSVGRHVGMGSIMGLNQMGNSVGFLAGSLIGAAVVETWGLDAVFRYAGIVTLAGALVFTVLMLRAAEELRDIDAAPALEVRERAEAAAG
jgi:MFS family permease